MKDFHLNYVKEIGDIKVSSYGGGSPRWVEIKRRDDSFCTMSIEECRDLRYALDRLLELTDEPTR